MALKDVGAAEVIVVLTPRGKSTKLYAVTTISGVAFGFSDEAINSIVNLKVEAKADTVESVRLLLEAAPELLEALSALADCAGISALPGYKPELDAAMIKARAAISKAEAQCRPQN